jgi:hypothetical protein
VRVQSILAAVCLTIAVGLVVSINSKSGSAQFETPMPKQEISESQSNYGSTKPQAYRLDSVTDSQQFPLQPMLLGRYQMSMQLAVNSNVPIVVVCDTATGECWQRNQANGIQWQSMGVPTSTVKTTLGIDHPVNKSE